MRYVICLSTLAACGTFDPRPVCSWEIEVVDETTGEVELRASTRIDCRDAETTPDRILYEALIDGGEPVTDYDLDAICDDGNLITALEAEALSSLTYVPWSEQDNGSVTYEAPEHAIDGAWFAVTFLETQPGQGGYASQEPWGAFFQLGVADTAEKRSVCREER